MGSSGRKRGPAAPRPAATIADASSPDRRAARSRTSVDIAAPEDEPVAVAAAERAPDSHEDAAVRAEAQADAVVVLELRPAQLRAPERHLPPFVKDAEVERGPDLHAVFGLDDGHVRAAESEL